jgi:hypothetical protein
MAEETFAQRIERLVQEHNRPLLLAEARQLLTIEIDGDGNLDLEPIVTALFILQHLTALQHITTPEPEQGDQQPSPDHWDKEFPITSVTRADLVSGGVSQEQASLLSDADMRAIARRMEDMYCDAGFWDDVTAALEYVQERKAAQVQRSPFPPLEM